jgi:enterochelin esterase-like enzyme
MHDGQMLFDSTITWNKQEWMVDETVASLLKNLTIKNVIVVGVWNGGKTRHIDYFPQKPFESLSKGEQDSLYQQNRPNGASVFNDGKVQSDNYLRFLVKELKPYIDSHFSTYKDKQNTYVAGSSMGGLISMYAICEYPNVFGGVACLSTHWPGIFTLEQNPIPQAFYNYLKKHLPDAKSHKIYFDYGTKTLDALYPPLQEQVDRIMKSKGFTVANWITKKFEGEDHSERAWQKRLYIPLSFLLKR